MRRQQARPESKAAPDRDERIARMAMYRRGHLPDRARRRAPQSRVSESDASSSLSAKADGPGADLRQRVATVDLVVAVVAERDVGVQVLGQLSGVFGLKGIDEGAHERARIGHRMGVSHRVLVVTVWLFAARWAGAGWRISRKVARTSSMTASGFSQGTKCPPRAWALM